MASFPTAFKPGVGQRVRDEHVFRTAHLVITKERREGKRGETLGAVWLTNLGRGTVAV